MEIRHITAADCDTIAKIHIDAFQGFFLTSLGVAFLRLYYKAVIREKNSVALCAVDDSHHIIGFAVGTLRARGFHKSLLKHNILSFLCEGIRLCITKPAAIWRLVRNMEKNNSPLDDGDYAELLSIGVIGTNKGSGIGGLLSAAFESETKERGAKKVTLTTDVDDNGYVLAFYEKMGYTLFYEFVAFPDRTMYKLIKNI